MKKKLKGKFRAVIGTNSGAGGEKEDVKKGDDEHREDVDISKSEVSES